MVRFRELSKDRFGLEEVVLGSARHLSRNGRETMTKKFLGGALAFAIFLSSPVSYGEDRPESAGDLEKEVARLERALITHPKEGAVQRSALRRALETARADLAQARGKEKRPE